MLHSPHVPDLEECICLYCNECFLIDEKEEPVCPKCGNRDSDTFTMKADQDEDSTPCSSS